MAPFVPWFRFWPYRLAWFSEISSKLPFHPYRFFVSTTNLVPQRTDSLLQLLETHHHLFTITNQKFRHEYQQKASNHAGSRLWPVNIPTKVPWGQKVPNLEYYLTSFTVTHPLHETQFDCIEQGLRVALVTPHRGTRMPQTKVHMQIFAMSHRSYKGNFF